MSEENQQKGTTLQGLERYIFDLLSRIDELQSYAMKQNELIKTLREENETLKNQTQ